MLPILLRRLLTSATALLLGAAASADAQVPPQIFPHGARVRVATPELSPHPTTGPVSRVAADTLFLQRLRYTFTAVPLEHIQTVEVASPGRMGRGALRGATTGALLGALTFGVHEAVSPSNCDYCPQGPSRIAFDAAIGAMLGTLVGVPLGALVGKDEWSLVWVASTPGPQR